MEVHCTPGLGGGAPRWTLVSRAETREKREEGGGDGYGERPERATAAPCLTRDEVVIEDDDWKLACGLWLLDVEAQRVAAGAEADLQVAAGPELLTEQQGGDVRLRRGQRDARQRELVSLDGAEMPDGQEGPECWRRRHRKTGLECGEKRRVDGRFLEREVGEEAKPDVFGCIGEGRSESLKVTAKACENLATNV